MDQLFIDRLAFFVVSPPACNQADYVFYGRRMRKLDSEMAIALKRNEARITASEAHLAAVKHDWETAKTNLEAETGIPIFHDPFEREDIQ